MTADGSAVLRGWLTDGAAGGLGLDEDLRWRLLRRLAVLGATDEAEIDAMLAESPDEEAALHAAWARAALPHEGAKARAWDLAMTVDSTSTYVVRATMEGFWHPEQRELLEPWVPAFFPAAIALSERRGAALAQTVGFRTFPFHDITEPTLELIRGCIADPATTVPLRRALSDRADDYARALAVRATWA